MNLTVVVTIFFAFLATAAHINNHFNAGCRGGFLGYPNIPPRSCASAVRTKPHFQGGLSVKFSQMPENARLFGYQGMPDSGACGVVHKRANTGDRNVYCMGHLAGEARYAGSSWARSVAKRNDNASADNNCIVTVAPVEIVLDDGHMYNLTAMADDMVEELYDLALSGTQKVTLPTQFASFEVDQAGVQERLQNM